MNVVSYSIFGDDSFYYNNVESSLTAARVMFPDWEIRLYYDDNLYSQPSTLVSIPKLKDVLNIKLILIEEDAPLCQAMLWRILPLYDLNTETVICRDIDSLLIPKERIAVEEFIKLDGMCHNIIDNTQHNTCLMGGLCGFSGPAFRKFFSLTSLDILCQGHDMSKKASDQTVLKEKIWPLMESNSVEHDFININTRRHFPTHVLSVVDESTSINSKLPKEKYAEANALTPFCGADSRQYDSEKALEFYTQYI